MLSFTVPAAGDTIHSIEKRTAVSSTWRFRFDDHPRYKNTGFDDAGWKKGVLPYKADLDTSKPHDALFLWIRGSFTVTKRLEGEKIFLLLGKTFGAVEVFVNGVLTGFHGSFPPDFNFDDASLKQYAIPPEIVRYDEPNLIAVRMFHEYGKFEIPEISIGNYDEYIFDGMVLNFINVEIYRIFSALCLILGGYYILHYAFRRKEKTNLYFALTNICFSLYFLNMGLEVSFLPYRIAGAFSQSFLPLFFGLLVVFFVNYLHICDNTWFKRIIMAKAVLLSLLFYLNAGSRDIIPNLFTLVLIPSGLELVFLVVISVIAVIRQNRDAIPIMIGSFIGFVLGMHDMICQISGTTPIAWLQGTGIFFFNMSMFVSLSIKTIRAFKDLEIYSAEISRKTGELRTYIENIREVSETVSNLSKTLGESIASASASIREMTSRSACISDDMKQQNDVVNKTEEMVMLLLDSLEGIYKGLEAQTEQVTHTSATINQMLKNTGVISKNVEFTSEFVSQLEEMTGKGEKAVLKSARSIEEIMDVSFNANKIIDAVSDLAEQTNILAINAAIEAAHAGNYGTGFAVVAGEIKRLAGGSAERSAEILKHITSIIRKIEEGVSTNNQVIEIFKAISGKTASTVDQVQSIYTAILEQKTASEQVLHSLERLSTTSQEIKQQADKQSSGSRIIRGHIEGLVDSTTNVMNAVASISTEISEMVNNISHIKGIMTESMKITDRLKDLLRDTS
ncbi:MAG: hypothetical protein JW881_05270 [Spirochaetales bacterium]|nr:hypothetical protein [Spirochaetales bacterium]